PKRQLRCLVLDDPATVCLGTEPVRVDGVPCGRVTSGGFGYRVGRSIAYAYLPSTVEIGARVQVSVFDTWSDATVSEEPLFDPTTGGARAWSVFSQAGWGGRVRRVGAQRPSPPNATSSATPSSAPQPTSSATELWRPDTKN